MKVPTFEAAQLGRNQDVVQVVLDLLIRCVLLIIFLPSEDPLDA